MMFLKHKGILNLPSGLKEKGRSYLTINLNRRLKLKNPILNLFKLNPSKYIEQINLNPFNFFLLPRLRYERSRLKLF